LNCDLKNEPVNLKRSTGYDMPRIKKKPADNTFFDDVYEVVRLIPKGRVTSYGAIAHFLGAKTGAAW
jgi:O6-methylguanine-DNA--protein-cysteine methyltransferase